MDSNEVDNNTSSLDSDNRKSLTYALNQALSSIVNCTEPTDPQAKEFKSQIESGNLPVCADPDAEKERIIQEWANQYRGTLDAIFTEVKWFRRRN
jgi:hypothetical protein